MRFHIPDKGGLYDPVYKATDPVGLWPLLIATHSLLRNKLSLQERFRILDTLQIYDEVT